MMIYEQVITILVSWRDFISYMYILGRPIYLVIFRLN